MPLIMGILAQGAAAPAAAGAYDLLETVEPDGTTGSVSFTGLDSYTDYKHLQIRAVLQGAASSNLNSVYLRINGDSGANYARHWLYGNGSLVDSAAGTSLTQFQFEITGSYSANDFVSASIIDILDFSSSSKNTTIRMLHNEERSDASLNTINLRSGLWNNTNAVTSISIDNVSGNYTNLSRLSLYGVK